MEPRHPATSPGEAWHVGDNSFCMPLVNFLCVECLTLFFDHSRHHARRYFFVVGLTDFSAEGERRLKWDGKAALFKTNVFMEAAEIV